MSVFTISALLLVFAGVFGLFNYHVLKLPTTIGLVVISFAVSVAMIVADWLLPGPAIFETVREIVTGIPFQEVVLDGLLSYLLFAGALRVNLTDLAEQKWVIAALATLGVGLSTVLVGLGFHWVTGIPLMVALVFRALISPTDPVAVMGILKLVKVPRPLETKIAGESLFNDGVGVVIFLILTQMTFGSSPHDAPVTTIDVLRLFVVEVLGGALLGGLCGYVTFLMIRSVDEFNLEVILTLALVTGTYSLAQSLHLSGPIAVVIAGLFIGNHGVRRGMSELTWSYVDKFWHLIDEILNAVLFLLIGFEVFAISCEGPYLMAAAVAIPLVLVARFIAIWVPISALGLRRQFTRGGISVMTWGGLRGGISVALALSLPDSEHKALLLTVTYAVVIFSIVI
jgi:monovalent cation:H+ antiporter, CPA1 family